MTRTSVNSKLRQVYVAIVIVLALSAFAAFADKVPRPANSDRAYRGTAL